MIESSASFAGALWLYALTAFLLGRRHRVYLADLSPERPDAGWPSLAVVFAARNEAPGIEAATRSLLALDYPELRVVAVNDRSSDATGEILQRLVERDARLTVIDVDVLPAGWLGKNHALQRGIEATRSDYVLLTDADVVFSAKALKKAVGYAVAAGKDLVTTFPAMLNDAGVFEKAFVALFSILLAMKHQNWMIESPRWRSFLGIGAFNLVRRQALEHIGCFDHLRLSVDDDVRLGEALKVHGFKLKVTYGTGEVEVKWQPSFYGYVIGLEKNGFAGLRFSFGELAFALIGTAVVCAGPYVALFVGPAWSRGAALVALLALAGLMHGVRRSTSVSAWYVLILPVSEVFFEWALVRSAFLTLKRRGIVWREHHYPLAELKAHVKERDTWMSAAWKGVRHLR